MEVTFQGIMQLEIIFRQNQQIPTTGCDQPQISFQGQGK